jgi:hypothetical protein
MKHTIVNYNYTLSSGGNAVQHLGKNGFLLIILGNCFKIQT